MMKSVFGIALLALFCLRAQAEITFNIDALDLKTSGGASLMPVSGLVLLVASTTDATFGTLTAGSSLTVGSFLSGDDLILYRGDLSGTATPGYFQAGVAFSLGANNLTVNDPVQLYWFPTLTVSTTSLSEGDTYGAYTHATGLDGSAAWLVPNDPPGGLFDLKFFTQTSLAAGSNPDALGYANFSVAPIPEASNVITAVLAGGLCLFRLVRGARQKWINSLG